MDNLPTLSIQHQKLTVTDEISLREATSYLSQLNSNLDQITAHKEAKTKPINEALRKIRADYKPLEEQLTSAIIETKQSILQYTTEQAKIALQREQKILNDKRTNAETKIQQLANLEQPTTSKVSTEQGNISFVTVKKYSIDEKISPDHARALLKLNILELNTTNLKAYIKTTGKVPEGIIEIEEQSLRNYR